MASHSTEDAQRIYEEVPTWGPHPDVPAGQGRQRDTAGHPGAVGRPPFFFVQCIRKAKRTGKPARVFADFQYRTRKSWRAPRRVIGKAE